MGHPSVEVTIRANPADHTAWSHFIGRDTKRGFWRYSSATIFVGTVILFSGLDYLLSRTSIPEGQAVVLSVGIGFLISSFAWKKAYASFAPKLFDLDGAYLRPYRMTASDDALVVTDDLSQARYSWKSFRRIEETGSYIYLFIDRASAVIVPERSFADKSQRADFMLVVRDKLKENGVS